MTFANQRPGVFIVEDLNPLITNGPGIPGEFLPAFAAAYPRGPMGPQLVQSWPEFQQYYGGFSTDPNNLLPFAVSQFFQNGGSSCFVLRVPNQNATTASIVLNDIETPDDQSVVSVTAASPGVWGNGLSVQVLSAGQTGRVTINVYLAGNAGSGLVEAYQDVSLDPTDRRYFVTMASQSIYINASIVLETPYVEGVNDLAVMSQTPMQGGGDGNVSPDLSTAIPKGFDTLKNQVLGINVPGLTDVTTLNALANWADGRGDVMIIVDGPVPNPPNTGTTGPDYSLTVTNNYLAMVQGGSALPSSTYMCVYAPWVQVVDPSSTLPGALRWLPPGGLVLGQWQATFILRGAHKTPAGITNIINIVQPEVQFSNAELDTLNDANICAIKLVPGIGYCIFGGRTLHPGYPDRFIGVRNKLIQMEHDFKWITQFALFEPNDFRLWKQITAVLQGYLSAQFQAGSLGGQSVSDSFAVLCDPTNNPENLAQAGIVTASVAVKLLSHAEWINITLSQYQTDGTQSTTTTS